MPRLEAHRATTEDLPELRALWQADGLSPETLEKRFTEFQVATDERGVVMGAIAMISAEGQGCLHSASLLADADADAVFTLLLSRLRTLARNLGLTRLWIPTDAPFWTKAGFVEPSSDDRAVLPASFQSGPANWRVLVIGATVLPGAPAAGDEIDKHMAILKAMSHAENERMMDQARVLRYIAYAVLAIVFGAFTVWVFLWMKLRPTSRR